MGGCVDIMSNSSVSQIAPEWFAEKTVEVKGEGYPKLKTAETPRTDEELRATAAQWRACVEEKKADCGTPDKPAAPAPGKSGR